MEGNNLNDILNQIKGVQTGINDMIVPMLKDTIDDYKKTFNKMVVIIVILIFGLLGTIGYSQYLIYKQNDKYNDFLSQFEFETEYIQEIDADGNSSGTIYDGININK